MNSCWPRPRPASTCSSKSRWASPPGRAARWPTPLRRPACCSPPAILRARTRSIYFSRTKSPRAISARSPASAAPTATTARSAAGSTSEWRWMADPKIAGVGAFGDLGTHKLDILMWLLGDIESVTADIKSGDRPLRRLRRNAARRCCSSRTASSARWPPAGWTSKTRCNCSSAAPRATPSIVNDKLYYRSKKVAGSDSHKPWTEIAARAAAADGQFWTPWPGRKINR